MKINEVIAESLYDTLTGLGQNVKAANAAELDKKANPDIIQARLSDPKIANNPRLLKGMRQRIAQELKAKGLSQQEIVDTLQQATAGLDSEKNYNQSIASARAKQAQAKPQQKFIDQFKLDQDTGVVEFGSKKYVRNANGNWVYFGSKRIVSPEEEQILDKVSPPVNQAEPAKTAPQPKPITVTDKLGVVWKYNDADRQWYGPDNEVVDDPESIKKLNRRAEVQFQNRAMATHELPGNAE